MHIKNLLRPRLLPGRNNTVKNGERNRPGRTSRRPADWFEAPATSPDSARVRRGKVFGETPKTAGATPALPKSTVSFRLIASVTGALFLSALASSGVQAAESAKPPGRKLLYAATPGIRDYLEYGGHGVLVFDIDHGHRFVKRIPSAGLDEKGKPLNVKGICANAATKRLYVSTIKSLLCFDLVTDKLLWEKSYDGGCDRMSMTPDGKVIYLPSLEKDHWHVVEAMTGEVLEKIIPKSGAHNTIVGPKGDEAYLAGLKSPLLRVAETK
ncbi:MAG TPA: hypothetical protein VGK40_13065, partial [Verrucomicrobiae bacterium]